MQQRLGVAARLLQALEHQVQRRLVGRRGVEVAGHLLVQRVAGVLRVDHGGHALEGLDDVFFGDHAVQQPVRHVLAGDAQRGAVFHQADVVDVRHLGAAHALVDPAHHITEDALGVVVQLLLLRLGAPVGRGRDGNLQQTIQDGVTLFVGVDLFRVLLDVGRECV